MVTTRRKQIGKALGKMRLSRETVSRLSAADPKEGQDCGCSASFSCPPQCKQVTGG